MSQSNVPELIPFIFEEVSKSIAKELLGKDISIIFDGTTRNREALAMLDPLLNGKCDFNSLSESSVNGDELARIVIEVLYRKLDVLQNSPVSAMRDQAPINSKAVSTVSILYPDMMDIGCIFNFLDRFGTEFVTQVLSSFM